MRRSLFHSVRPLEVKDQAEGRVPGVPFPWGHGPSKTKKNETKEGGERNPRHHKKLMAGKQGEEEGWRVGNRASPVAECKAHIDLQRGGPSGASPHRTGGQCWFCWQIFFFWWGAFFLRSRHRSES